MPSLLLCIRSARKRVSDVLPSAPTWTLSSAPFDYIVCKAIGVPFVLVVFPLVLLFSAGSELPDDVRQGAKRSRRPSGSPTSPEPHPRTGDYESTVAARRAAVVTRTTPRMVMGTAIAVIAPVCPIAVPSAIRTS